MKDSGGFFITRMRLQLANRSIQHLKGIAEDVPIRPDKCIFLINFVVLNIDVHVETPLIHERPFLPSGKALINMDGGEMMLRVRDEMITYQLVEATRQSLDFNDV